jgi:hypothetical protein
LIEDSEHEVLNVDKLTYAGSLTTVEPVAGNPRYSVVQADICDQGAVSRILADFDPEVPRTFILRWGEWWGTPPNARKPQRLQLGFDPSVSGNALPPPTFALNICLPQRVAGSAGCSGDLRGPFVRVR